MTGDSTASSRLLRLESRMHRKASKRGCKHHRFETPVLNNVEVNFCSNILHRLVGISWFDIAYHPTRGSWPLERS